MDRKVTEFLRDFFVDVNEQNEMVDALRAELKESEDDLAMMVESEVKLRAELKRLKEEG